MAVNQTLLDGAEEIRDASAVGENTALRVGTELVGIVEEIGDVDDKVDDLDTDMDEKADLNNGTERLEYSQAPVVVLDSMGTTLDSIGSDTPVIYTPNQGDYIWATNSIRYYKVYIGPGEANVIVNLGSPVPGIVYTNRKTGLSYIWDTATSSWVQVGRDGTVKSVTVNGETYTPEDGDVDLGTIGHGGTSIDLIDDMESAGADTTLDAPTSRVVKEIYINLKALFDNLAGIAFVGTAPTWQTVDAPTYTLTKSLTSCTASVITGDAGGGKVNEGTVVIRLTPSTVGYSFSTISVVIGGEAVEYQRTDNIDGTVDITFTANGDITLTATAVSGYAINVIGSHVTSSQSHSGSTYTVTLVTDDSHFSLPDNIVVKHGGTTLQQGTDYTYNKATGDVVIPNVNDNTYSIKVTVNEDAHATISMAAGVTNVVGTHGGNPVTFPLKVYDDMLVGDEYDIVFAPASGCKFTTNPNVGGVDLTDNTLTVTDSDVTGEENIEVSAAARPLNTYNISLPNDANITVDDGNGGSVPATILEDSPLTIRLTPAAGYAITIDTETMGVENLTPTESGGVYTFTIAEVTGDIVITATAAKQPTKVHSYDFNTVVPTTGRVDGKPNYIEDDIAGHFRLYKKTDITTSSEATADDPAWTAPGWSPAGGSYDGEFANGALVATKYRAGYGNRAIDIPIGNDFTIILKNVTSGSNNNTVYNANMIRVRAYDNTSGDNGVGSIHSGAAAGMDIMAQQFFVSVVSTDHSKTFATANGSLEPFIKWNGGSAYLGNTNAIFPVNPSAGDTYDLVYTYVASNGTIKGYVVKHSSGAATILEGATATRTGLAVTCIQVKFMELAGGMDIYDAALSAQQLGELYSNE